MTEPNTMMQALEACRITPETEVKQHRFLFRLFGKPCFPRGELVALSGKKKSGKTFFCSNLLTLCARQESLSMSRIETPPLHALWIDTEQSDDSTQEILVERIFTMVGPENAELLVPGSMDIFNLRCQTWSDRLPLIEMAVRQCHPDLVIFDGIRDVVNDINDSVMAQMVVERLMALAQQNNCCIVCVLHQNKSLEDKTLRGALGTELGNKCFEEYESSKERDMLIFTIKQLSTRKYDIVDNLKFTLTDKGLPILLTPEQLESLNTSNASNAPTPFTTLRRLNRDYMKDGDVDYQRAFRTVMEDGEEVRAYVLQKRFMELVGLNSENWYGRCRTKALEDGLLIRTEHGQQNVTYRLATS